MHQASTATVTQLLGELKGGNREVLDELFSLVYGELVIQARRNRVKWHGDYTLNTTALVHEAYLKLVNQDEISLESRSHFLGTAASAMRHILIDYARSRQTQKRGGDVQKISLDDEGISMDEIPLTDEQADAIVALGDALERLAEISESESRVVECRVFAGMTVKETAEVMGVSATTVKRDWAMAKAWLFREMQREVEK